MSTDRELLEMAAKAAGIQIDGNVNDWIAQPGIKGGGFLIANDRGGQSSWNPLTDDGDALRLAVTLHLSLVDYKNADHAERRTSVKVWEGHDSFLFQQELHGEDPLAATRRAIVRAAAAIGAAK